MGRKTIGALTVALALGLGFGCGDETGVGNCTDLCKEAQAGSCTNIKGDCAAFCAALDRTKGKANCTAQSDTYQSCLNAKSNVCDSSCGSQETALSTCVGAYCLTHASEADCKTMLASFQ